MFTVGDVRNLLSELPENMPLIVHGVDGLCNTITGFRMCDQDGTRVVAALTSRIVSPSPCPTHRVGDGFDPHIDVVKDRLQG